MRHGESEANKEKIIISKLDNGLSRYGLTQKGEKQVLKAIKKNKIFDDEMIIFSSNFKRARETAMIIIQNMKIKNYFFTEYLKERDFGDFEKRRDGNYKKIWELDMENPNHEIYNVESVNEVLKRMIFLIDQIEKKNKDKNILLISHGDPLQILTTVFINEKVSNHRIVKHLKPAEIRELKLIR
ncbi:MAG: histidine phosphatase family protein [Spirochaetes bacterium]|nr:histidine phosphatase family protein [Spirochaetota bacterium]